MMRRLDDLNMQYGGSVADIPPADKKWYDRSKLQLVGDILSEDIRCVALRAMETQTGDVPVNLVQIERQAADLVTEGSLVVIP